MPKSPFPANAEGMPIFTVSGLLNDLAAFAAVVLFVTTMAVVLPDLSAAIHDGRQTIAQATEE